MWRESQPCAVYAGGTWEALLNVSIYHEACTKSGQRLSMVPSRGMISWGMWVKGRDTVAFWIAMTRDEIPSASF